MNSKERLQKFLDEGWGVDIEETSLGNYEFWIYAPNGKQWGRENPMNGNQYRYWIEGSKAKLRRFIVRKVERLKKYRLGFPRKVNVEELL